jgi:gas vesicle protein
MKAVCGYFAAGIGIGAALSMLFAPKPGEETRKWVANKCLDAIEAANWKVWRSRLHVRHVMNRGQQEIIKAVEAGRGAFGGQKEPESPISVL